MRVIIAGSRSCIDPAHVFWAVEESGFTPSVVLSGTARGADQCGEVWAECVGVPVEKYPAEWNRYGKQAGFLRNEQMANNADALIALWDGVSPGTRHMINTAYHKELRVFIYRTDQHPISDTAA